MSVRFSDTGLNTIWLRNPELGNFNRIEKKQVLGRSAAGNTYCYDKGVQNITMTLRWVNLREDEKVDFSWFYRNIADGVMNEVIYVDQRGVVREVRFLNTELTFTETRDLRESSGTYPVQGTDYPTTTREEGTWEAECILELITGAS